MRLVTYLKKNLQSIVPFKLQFIVYNCKCHDNIENKLNELPVILDYFLLYWYGFVIFR